MSRIASVLAFLGSLAFQARHVAYDAISPDVTWYRDADQATRTAGALHKPIVLFFGAEWDCASKEMTVETFRDPEVRWLLHQSFVAAQIDGTDDESPAWHVVQRRYKVVGTPTTIILAPDGKTELARFSEVLRPPRLAAELRAARR